MDRRAVIQGWRQVVGGLDGGSDRTGRHRCRAEGRPPSRQPAGPPGTGGEPRRAAGTGDRGRRRIRPRRGLRSTPASFTLDSETRDVTSWSGLLVGVCLMMRDSHPGDFERILEIRGRKLPYFSRAAGELNLSPAHRGHGHFRLLPWDRGPDRRARPPGGGTLRTPCRVLGHPVEVTSAFSCQLMMRR